MSFEAYPGKITEQEGYLLPVTFVGNNTAVPTKSYGRGVTVSRTGVGTYLLTFSDSPGNFVGLSGTGFQSATTATNAGWTAVAGTFTQATGATKASLVIATFNSTFAAGEMQTTQTLALDLRFKRGQATI